MDETWASQVSQPAGAVLIVIEGLVMYLSEPDVSQKYFVFRNKDGGKTLAKQIGWYVFAFCVITCIVNSINYIWVAVEGLLLPDFIYNIGATVLNGGVSMVGFFFVNKIIFLVSD